MVGTIAVAMVGGLRRNIIQAVIILDTVPVVVRRHTSELHQGTTIPIRMVVLLHRTINSHTIEAVDGHLLVDPQDLLLLLL